VRATLSAAAVAARTAGAGLWAHDRTLAGADGSSVATLEQDGVIFPKLFRRLVEFYASGQVDLSTFGAWLASTPDVLSFTLATRG
jgi:hypothetical protein